MLKYALNLFLTKRYYIVLIFTVFLLVMSNIFIIIPLNERNHALATYNNFTATAISYDSSPDTSDSLTFYNENVFATKNKNDDVTLNACIYQKRDVNYTNKCIYNEQNLLSGNSLELKQNEALISISMSNKYTIKIGDSIFLNNSVECIVKGITYDFYEIKRVDFNSKKMSILIGNNTLSTKNIDSYCNFDVKTGESRNKIYSMNQIRSTLNQNVIVFCALLVLLNAISIISPLFIKKTKEIKSFAILKNSGCKLFTFRLFENEIVYMLPTLAIVEAIIICNGAVISQCIILLSCILILGILHSLYLIKETHNG